MRVPQNLVNKRIRYGFRRLPENIQVMFSLTRGRSAATAIEKTFLSTDPRIGLRGLGKPVRELLPLEIGCENLDAAKAAALSGIRNYHVNSVEMTSMIATGYMADAARLRTHEVPGPIQNVFFTSDYDFFIACRMGRDFEHMPTETFTRIIHGNAKEQRLKRIYLFDGVFYYNEYIPFFSRLEDAGFELKETWPTSNWFAAVAEMEAIPGKVEIERPKDGIMCFSIGPETKPFEEAPDRILKKMMRERQKKEGA